MNDLSTDRFPTSDPTWELESMFEGGSQSEAFGAFLEDLGERLDGLAEEVEAAPELREVGTEDRADLERWAEMLDERQRVGAYLMEASAFARGHASADAENPAAAALPQRVDEFSSRVDAIDTAIVQRFQGVSDEVIEALTEWPRLEALELYLREYRRRAKRAMSEGEERLAAELNRDGLHAWGQFYRLVSGSLTVHYRDPETGEREEHSVGQIKNKLSDPERPVRRNAHQALQEAWGDRAPEFASMLNSILGSRLTLNDRRGVDPLTEPLQNNRIERRSLEAMFEAVEAYQPAVRQFLETKADALGVEELESYDVRAPVGGEGETSIGWERAQEFIVEQVDSFSRRMGEFYRHALGSQWVEAEDRDGKAQGGFCMPFPVSEEIRVFLTFSGTMSGVMVLAHELGHAYHFWTLRDRVPAARQVPMTLAESASTLSEKVVESAALESADRDQKLRLLDERLGRAATFLLDIPARFQLEQRMLEARREGRLAPQQLTEMTREAFGETFGDVLGSFDDYFWASKLHYYLSRAPFYNFPYTFGYLFSKSIHQRIRGGDTELREGLDELLRESGRRSAESLAEEFLGADLGDPEFWSGALESIRDDVDRYGSLVESGR